MVQNRFVAKRRILSWLILMYESQTYVGSGQQNKGPAKRIPQPRRSAESAASEKVSNELLSERAWEMVEEIQAITENFQYIMDHLSEWLVKLGTNDIRIRELRTEWNTLQSVCDS